MDGGHARRFVQEAQMLLQGPGSGAEPATHAFVVGVSHYPFLNGPKQTSRGEELRMVDLSSAARSASDVAAWLLTKYHNPAAPLADISIFLSPSDREKLNPVVAKALGRKKAPALRDKVEVAFEEFRTTCARNPDNVAFVYVAGHGMQLELHSAIVLLQDFAVDGRNELYGGINIAACRESMDCDGQASHQVWFSDACRQRPELVKQFDTLTGAYTPPKRIGNVKASPIFLAAASREQAFAKIGEATIFSAALLWALDGGCAKGPSATCPDWHVPATRLITALPERVNELLTDFSEQQTVQATGTVQEVVVQRLQKPPDVDIEVALSPADLAPVPTAELLFRAVAPQLIVPGWPLKYLGPPGIYQLKVTTGAGSHAEELFNAEPPRFRHEIKVT
jgi:Caspase domain